MYTRVILPQIYLSLLQKVLITSTLGPNYPAVATFVRLNLRTAVDERRPRHSGFSASQKTAHVAARANSDLSASQRLLCAPIFLGSSLLATFEGTILGDALFHNEISTFASLSTPMPISLPRFPYGITGVALHRCYIMTIIRKRGGGKIMEKGEGLLVPTDVNARASMSL